MSFVAYVEDALRAAGARVVDPFAVHQQHDAEWWCCVELAPPNESVGITGARRVVARVVGAGEGAHARAEAGMMAVLRAVRGAEGILRAEDAAIRVGQRVEADVREAEAVIVLEDNRDG